MWLRSPEFVCGYLIKYSLFLWISCVMRFIAGITWQTNCYYYLHTHKYALMESLNNLRGLFRIPSEKKSVCVVCFLQFASQYWRHLRMQISRWIVPHLPAYSVCQRQSQTPTLSTQLQPNPITALIWDENRENAHIHTDKYYLSYNNLTNNEGM